MITTNEYLQSLKNQKNTLTTHLNKTHIKADKTEVFNTLIGKVKTIIETPRIEVEYNGEDIVKARLYFLKAITPYLFYGQPITDIEFYNCNITSIGIYAFSNTYLSSFNIPDTVTEIGNYAFYQSRLRAIVFPSSVTSIGSNAFYGTYLTAVNIPDSITTIGYRAFYECSSLRTITLPDTPVELGSDVFARTSISTFTFPKWLTKIPSQMFYCCYSLRLTSLPDWLTSIGSGSFQATACTFTEIPETVTNIGSNAFVGILSTSLTISNRDTTVGTGLLAGSSKVETLRISCNLPNGVITNSINKNSTLKYVEIGGNIKKTAFVGCTGLLKVWIRESCTEIEVGTTASDKPFYGNTRLVIYAEADNKPDGWADDFNQISTTAYASVNYGVKTSPF